MYLVGSPSPCMRCFARMGKQSFQNERRVDVQRLSHCLCLTQFPLSMFFHVCVTHPPLKPPSLSLHVYLTPLSLFCVHVDYSRQVQEEILAQSRAYDDLLRKITDHTPSAPPTSDQPLSPSRPLELAICLRDFLNPHLLPPLPSSSSPSSPLSSPRLPRNDTVTTAYQRYCNTFTDFTQVPSLSPLQWSLIINNTLSTKFCILQTHPRNLAL